MFESQVSEMGLTFHDTEKEINDQVHKGPHCVSLGS